MLLRLLPAPKPNQAAPPTILFTLPLVTAPYTSKSLPLPPNLLTHRSACAREGVECSNVLLGDKAAWIVGVIDEVTFSVRDSRITVSLVDGNNIILPIDNGCGGMLDGVIKQVHLSFANNTPTTPVSAPAPASSMTRSTSSGSSSGKRSPSALLSALLSPIMANVTPATPAPAPINPSRLHRRQARSLLVDAFRRHVLPNLKEMLPANYMLWSLQGELRVKRDEWMEIKTEVDRVLTNAGHSGESSIKKRASYSSIGGSTREGFASSSSLNSDASDSDSDADSTPPLTPATSVWGQTHSSRSSVTPLGHLSTLPACVALPPSHRANYANLVSRLASLASRLTSIQKTIAAIEKEDGRKRWLESLEASRQLEKANRRAMSAMCGKQLMVTSSPFNTPFAPVRSSGLWQSHVVGEEVQEEEHVHPAMSMVAEEEDDEMTDDDVFSPNIIVRPISPLNASSIFSCSSVPSVLQPAPSGSENLMPQPRRSSLGDNELLMPPSADKLANRRPSIETMDLGNYRIVPTSAIDSDEGDEMLGQLAGAQLHDIPSKTGEAGFRVGVAIVR